MKDKSSQEFKEAANEITTELTAVFSETEGFSNVIVLELRPLIQSRDRVVGKQGVNATVDIIFTTNSEVTTPNIVETLKNASECQDSILAGSSFKDKNLCDDDPCDKNTTTCESRDGVFSCKCDEKYIKSDLTDRLCIACPSGYRAENSETCVKCSFGRTGLNCNEYWQLGLVIVVSVLGGLFIISVIALPLVTSRSMKKNSKKNQNDESGNPYARHFPTSSPVVVGNSSQPNSQASSLNGLIIDSDGGIKIPRAKVSGSLNSRPDHEMDPSTSRQNSYPYFEEDDINTQSRPQSSLGAQARPWNKPLTLNRPQVNLYGQSQGHSNPSFISDNGRSQN